MSWLNRIRFFFKKPKVVIITGSGCLEAKGLISGVLGRHFKLGREVLIFSSEFMEGEDLDNARFLIDHSSLSVVVVTGVGSLDKMGKIRSLVRKLPLSSVLVLNHDNELVRGLADEAEIDKLSFGFLEKADFKASDLGENNFKVNYKGNIVPVWLEGEFDKKQVYAALSAFSVGVVLSLNLIEVSQGVKEYQG